MTKGSDLLVAALENEGVECFFAVRAEENPDLLESHGSKVELIVTRHQPGGDLYGRDTSGLTRIGGICSLRVV